MNNDSMRDDAISVFTLFCGESYHVWTEKGVAWAAKGSPDYWLYLNWENNKTISVEIFDTLKDFEPAFPKTGEMGLYAVIGYCHLHEISISINNATTTESK